MRYLRLCTPALLSVALVHCMSVLGFSGLFIYGDCFFFFFPPFFSGSQQSQEQMSRRSGNTGDKHNENGVRINVEISVSV